MSEMTDAQALAEIDGYVPRHCRAAIEHIAARLRGDAVQLMHSCRNCEGIDPESCINNIGSKPAAPAPVAGDAVPLGYIAQWAVDQLQSNGYVSTSICTKDKWHHGDGKPSVPIYTLAQDRASQTK